MSTNENTDISQHFWEWMQSYWHNNRDFPPAHPDWRKKADLINGKIPAAQLPSYVDDVLEFETFEQLPKPGEKGKIYVVIKDNTQFRWSGSDYIELNSDHNLMTLSTDQSISGQKYFITSNGNDILNQKLWLRSFDGSNPAAVYYKDGYGSGALSFDGDQFHLTNIGVNASAYLNTKGIKKDNSNDDYLLLGGGGHRNTQDFIFGSNPTGTIEAYPPDLGQASGTFNPKKSGFYRPNNDNNYKDLLIWVNHPGWNNGAYGAGLAFDYGGGEVFLTGKDDLGIKLPNKKIWHAGNLEDYHNYGLGSTTSPIVNDLSGFNYTSFYRITPDTSGRPFNYGTILNQMYQGGELTQLAIDITTGKLQTRARNSNNGFTLWQKYITDGIEVDGKVGINNGSAERSNKVWFDYNWAETGRSGSVINFSGLEGGNYSTELFSEYNGDRVGIRTHNGDNNTWNLHKWLWHSNNFNPDSKANVSQLFKNLIYTNNLNTVIASGIYRQEGPSSGYFYTTTLNLNSDDGRQQLSIDRYGKGMKFRSTQYGSGDQGWTDWRTIVTAETDQDITGLKNINRVQGNYGSGWNLTKNKDTYALLVETGQGSSPTDNYGTAIGFHNEASGGAQASIIVRNNGANGTSMGFATTDSYAAGPQLALSINNTGKANFERQLPSFQNKDLATQEWISNNYLPLSGGVLTGTLFIKTLNSTSLTGGQIINAANSTELYIGNPSLPNLYLESADNDLFHYRTGYGVGKIWDAHNFNPDNKVNKSGDTMSGQLNVPDIGLSGGIYSGQITGNQVLNVASGILYLGNSSGLSNITFQSGNDLIHSKTGIGNAVVYTGHNFNPDSKVNAQEKASALGFGAGMSSNAPYIVHSTDGPVSLATQNWVKNNCITTDTSSQTKAGNLALAAGATFKVNGVDSNHIQSYNESTGNVGVVSAWVHSHYATRWKAGNKRGGSTESLGYAFHFSDDNGATYNEKVLIQPDGNIVTANFGTASAWYQAYNWGNHANAGYATQNYVSQNYIPKSHPVNNITAANIDTWDNAIIKNAPFDTATGNGLAITSGYYSSESGLYDTKDNFIVAGKVGRNYKFASTSDGFEGITVDTLSKNIGYAGGPHPSVKHFYNGQVMTNDGFCHIDLRKDQVFVPDGSRSDLRKEVVNENSQIRLRPFDSIFYGNDNVFDTDNRLVYITLSDGGVVTMKRKFKYQNITVMNVSDKLGVFRMDGTHINLEIEAHQSVTVYVDGDETAKLINIGVAQTLN